MQHPSKRRASRSPSPQLPGHYLSSFSQPRTSSSPLDLFRIQAHEATLVTGQVELARHLETRGDEGGALGRWSGSTGHDADQVWIDRYDILNLLPSVPSYLPFSNPSSFPPVSLSNVPPSTACPEDERGFSDLASDHEEEFYFRKLPVEEREELEKKRKRKRLERGREERIRLLEEQESRGRAEAHDRSEEVETEPSETQLSMMKRLHTTLSAAQNPSLLEMRILTNHSHDPKFQFLKKGGRWRDVWERIRKGEKVELSKNASVPTSQGGTTVAGLVGLGDYGSSDSESGQENEEEPVISGTEGSRGNADVATAQAEPVTESAVDAVDDAEESEVERKKREAKAQKVREWARKRREARDDATSTVGL